MKKIARIPVEDLLKKTNSIYKLVILASRRASELNTGMPKLVEFNSERPGSIALEEIGQGKVTFKVGSSNK